jgi:hypothetical protein
LSGRVRPPLGSMAMQLRPAELTGRRRSECGIAFRLLARHKLAGAIIVRIWRAVGRAALTRRSNFIMINNG